MHCGLITSSINPHLQIADQDILQAADVCNFNPGPVYTYSVECWSVSFELAPSWGQEWDAASWSSPDSKKGSRHLMTLFNDCPCTFNDDGQESTLVTCSEMDTQPFPQHCRHDSMGAHHMFCRHWGIQLCVQVSSVEKGNERGREEEGETWRTRHHGAK